MHLPNLVPSKPAIQSSILKRDATSLRLFCLCLCRSRLLLLSVTTCPKLAVFPEGSPVMSVEAGGIQGWQRWAHAPFGMARFGASAPFKAIYNKFGYTVENLTKQASFVPACLLA